MRFFDPIAHTHLSASGLAGTPLAQNSRDPKGLLWSPLKPVAILATTLALRRIAAGRGCLKP